MSEQGSPRRQAIQNDRIIKNIEQASSFSLKHRQQQIEARSFDYTKRQQQAQVVRSILDEEQDRARRFYLVKWHLIK